jgi:hypothetical protein
MNDLVVFHLFRTSTLNTDEHFAPTALQSHGKTANVELNDAAIEVLAWHYKHSLIMSWGGYGLRSYMRSFPIAGDDVVARSNDQEVFDYTSPASSADLFPWD